MDKPTVAITPEQAQNKALRAEFIRSMLPHVPQYLKEISSSDALIVQQPRAGDDVQFIKISREKAAQVYESIGAPEVATILREEPHIPGAFVVCFNAYDGYNAMLLMPNTTMVEA
jgi:hypothetical protein